MKKIVLPILIVMTSTFSFAKQLADAGGFSSLALVYKGPGACDENCAEAAGKVALMAGYQVQYVHPGEITPALLETADLWVQPGGDALDVRAAISNNEFYAIKNFVANGGKYLGFCAGAYLATKFIDDALTIPGFDFIPGDSEDYVKGDKTPRLETIVWHGVRRELYFQDGPSFIIQPGHEDVVKATYLNGKPAIIFTPYMRGYVALSGPHPEALGRWMKADGLLEHNQGRRWKNPLVNDNDQADADIALEMIDWLRKGH
jgi:glutamine amidotransferase-like uncharacterized protein